MGNRKLDKIIVVDLEATCWQPRHSKPMGMKSEIIEIGVCALNLKTMEPVNKVSYYIRPTISEVSEFCVELTGITTELLKEKGIPFRDAINKLKKDFGPSSRTWVSWGAYDRNELIKECERYRVDYPMGRNHINFKNLWAYQQGLSRELGLGKALKHLGMDFEGRQHSGADDAWNIARLLALSFKKESDEKV